MKLNVSQNDSRFFRLSIPRWLYMNSLGVSIAATKKDVPITPRQARKSLRAVKKAMRVKGITTIAQIEVITGDAVVNIEI